jgi:hypothetical protein
VPRCTLRQRLDELLANASGTVSPKPQALHEALAGARLPAALRPPDPGSTLFLFLPG